MKCPYCNHQDTRVTDSRAMEDDEVIRRRRLCDKCSEKFTTYERVDTIPLIVIKRSGVREVFDRTKLFNGIMKSCNKRPISISQIESVVSEIQNHVLNSMSKEIESKEIGDLVMPKLKEIDEVSYVRFASVYRQFKDIDTFMDELSKLLREKE